MRIPVATYRLQFNADFPFQAAAHTIPYLVDLGITDIYASPIFKARAGSLHGYDVVDPAAISPELGTPSQLDRLMDSLESRGMGWIQDIVPNHMAFDGDNRMLMDVLEKGPRSQYYRFFDITWDHPYEGIKGRLLAPFLGRPYGETLEDGELGLRYDQRGFAMTYYDLAFPLAAGTYARLLKHRIGRIQQRLGRDHPDFISLLEIISTFEAGDPGDETPGRLRQVGVMKRRLWDLYRRSRPVRGFIDENLQHYAGQKGHPESFDLLDDLLNSQVYRLSFWKVATEEINYRRFFNINGLICLKTEAREVFDRVHSLVFERMEAGRIFGLRIDHVDGLYDPAGYLERLRRRMPDAYVVVEKILGPEEVLPPSWPVQGTTGYDFMNVLNGLFCMRAHEGALSRIYRDFTWLRVPFAELLKEKKLLIIERHMGGDVDNLALFLKSASARDRHGRDITLYGLRRTLVAVLASFPVYRTYIRAESCTDADRACIETAVKGALEDQPDLLKELDFVRRFLLLEPPPYLSEEDRKSWRHFVMRFQQFTGPLMAKGLEDTALYVYNRLLSLNEVGGDPSRFGLSLQEFHRFNEERALLWPHGLNATATHDTKRGEDVRARINVLSEIPAEWEQAVKRWRKINQRKKKRVGNITAPDRNDEYFLYQTLVGTMPFSGRPDDTFVERIRQYAIKAVREAKVHTAWLKDDADYEDAVLSFITAILDPAEDNPFLKDFLPFQRKIAHFGMLNSLSQTLLKITCPGVPDFYQGTELWDLTLVDPDNRRPVDFKKRKELLDRIRNRGEQGGFNPQQELPWERGSGLMKLFLIHRAIGARRQRADLFQQGRYLPLDAEGKFSGHVVAFARNLGHDWSITVAPRFLTAVIQEGEYPLGRKVWGDTRVILPPDGASGAWGDMVQDRTLPDQGRGELFIGDILRSFPVSLLFSTKDP